MHQAADSTHGTVTAKRGESTYTAFWKIEGEKLILDFQGETEPAFLGMFEKEPAALAHMLLLEMIHREFGE
jgi:hypothetical protein